MENQYEPEASDEEVEYYCTRCGAVSEFAAWCENCDTPEEKDVGAMAMRPARRNI